MPILSNSQHEKFCLAYVATPNGSRACIAAGYSPNGASVSANRLLKSAKIQNRIAELQAMQERRINDVAAVDAAFVLQRLRIHADSGIDANGKTDAKLAASSVKALELLGRHLKMFTDKLETSDGKGIDDLTVEQLDHLYELVLKRQTRPEKLEEQYAAERKADEAEHERMKHALANCLKVGVSDRESDAASDNK